MKKSKSVLECLALIVLLAMGTGLAGCKSSGDRSLAQKWGDRQVAKAVSKKLKSDPQYKYPDVKPVVYEGTVQLTGFVDTPEHRQRAAELASHATGVREVVNSIALKPTPTGREMVNTNAPVPTSSSNGQ